MACDHIPGNRKHGQKVIEELESVVITRDIPEYVLYRGHIGVVVHCYKDGIAFEVEFVTGKGETVGVLPWKQKTSVRCIPMRYSTFER